MSDSLNRIVGTPIRLELLDNNLSLDEENSYNEIMENNTYQVKIHTNEILDECSLVLKRYGNLDLIKINKELTFETIRLIRIESTNEKLDCWGLLKLSEGSSDQYMAELYSYSLIEKYGEVPNLKKQDEVITEKIGEVYGVFEKNGETGDYNFKAERLNWNNKNFNYRTENVEGKIENYFEENTTNGTKQKIYVNIIVSSKFSEIPEPPQVDKNLIVPENITFTKEITLESVENEKLENLIFNFKNFVIPFSAYSENLKQYTYNCLIEIPEDTKFNSTQVNPVADYDQSPEPTTLEESTPSEVVETFVELKIGEQLIIQKKVETEKVASYKSASGRINIGLSFSEEDFSIYNFSLDIELSLIVVDDIPKTDDKGANLYNLPKLTVEKEKIQAIELDGTGEIIYSEQPAYEYLKNGDNFVYDDRGRKIPIYKRNNEPIKLDEEGYAIPLIKLEEQADGSFIELTEMLPEIIYETDINGDILYEITNIPIYKTNDEGKLVIDSNGELVISGYETDANGIYIQEKRALPKYLVNDNNDILRDTGKKDEQGNPIYSADGTGEVGVVYKTNGTGEPLVDANGQYILAYEKYDNGEYKLDENNEKTPIYEKEIIDGEEVDKERPANIIPLRDKDNNIVYETELIEGKEMTMEFNSNLLPQYETETINGKRYYKLDKNEQLIVVMRDTENEDEKGNPIKEIVYATDDKGNSIEFPNYIQVMTIGDTVQNFKNITENIVDVIIAYNGFSYSKEAPNKEDFAPEQLEENNIYTTELPASELMPGTPKIFLGVVKYTQEVARDNDGKPILDNENNYIKLYEETSKESADAIYVADGYYKDKNGNDTTYIKCRDRTAEDNSEEKYYKAVKSIEYATNAVEFEVTRSIETANWESMEEFLNEKIVYASYNSEVNAYYETSTEGASDENKGWLEGRENYIYIDIKDIETNGAAAGQPILRKWKPDVGFYKLALASNTIV